MRMDSVLGLKKKLSRRLIAGLSRPINMLSARAILGQ